MKQITLKQGERLQFGTAVSVTVEFRHLPEIHNGAPNPLVRSISTIRDRLSNTDQVTERTHHVGGLLAIKLNQLLVAQIWYLGCAAEDGETFDLMIRSLEEPTIQKPQVGP